MPRSIKKKTTSTAKEIGKAARELFGEFRSAKDVLTNVRAISTVLTQFDHATGVGGFPIERVTVMHGPSNEGKTLAALAFMRSFLVGGHYVFHVDAEWATPGDWVEKILGEHAASGKFFALRPKTFEEAREEVGHFLRKLQEGKKKGVLPAETSALVVVDSVKKLQPARILDRMLKDEGGIDGMGGRAAQYKAALNASWLDELVPLLGESGGAALLLARESEDPNADVWAKKYGNDYKVGGGKALVYDSSLVLRVVRAGWVTKGEGKEREIYGERHRITIRKTKIAGKDDKVVDCYFHSSNGQLVPFGLDRARDLVELGVRFGVIQDGGAGRFTWGEHKWRGEHAAVEVLSGDFYMLAELEGEVRKKFKDAVPIQFDESTGELL